MYSRGPQNEANLRDIVRVNHTGGVVMFVRFVIPIRHEDSHCMTGVIQAAYRLRERGLLSDGEEKLFDGIRCWFNRHLPVPRRFSRSRRPHAHRNAVCWFKVQAEECLDRMRELAALLQRKGVATEVLETQRPGYIVYEDDYQVAAVPFRDTRA